MKKFTLRVSVTYLMISGLTLLIIKYVTLGIGQGWYYWPVVTGIYLLGTVAFYFWMNSQTLLICKLNEMVQAFAKGNLEPAIFITSDDELGQLNDSLLVMAENLNKFLKKAVQERDRMETILESMVEGVLVFDCAGRLILMNKTAEEMIGISFEVANKRYFLEILRNHQLADLLKRCLSDGRRQVIEVRIAPLSPEIYRVYITPIIRKDTASQGAIMVLRNVTKVRMLEQMRSEFVANVSHELRTLLTSIKGYVETLLDGALESREISEHFLTIINAETDRLNRLISDLLYLSQLETGRMEVAKKTINSRRFLDKVINLLKPVAQSRDITIETAIDPLTPSFYANQDMMEQVLINLLDNAIKYSHVGGAVKVEIGPHEQGTVIRVIDEGIGIPAESLPRVFERFYRVDKGRSRQVGGTGLGLSIVKHVVDRHRGQVQVESEEEKGSTFTIILPNA